MPPKGWKKDAPKTKRAVAEAVHEANQVAVVDEPAFQARSDVDEFDLNNGVLEHYGFDRLTGSAVEQIMEARKLKGEQRRSKLQRAIRYLALADAQATTTAVAMCIALPAFPFVILRCARII